MKTVSSTLKRLAVPALAVSLAVPAFATPAAAATPGSTALRLFGMVVLSARSGVANHVTASTSTGRVVLTDDTGIALGPGCVRLSATSVDCGSVAGTSRLSVGLGDLADSFDGTSVSLPTLVDAGAGSDTVATGSGNDTIGVSGDAPAVDTVSCDGGSADVVFADPGDSVAADCETRR
ncbi:hypothetical protein [Streptomyces sp. NRRL S-646]|uniref:hypothetical protein n=1 Tax=Streptomyces sp. NRRL S-646 TaxID=1463917 RepID=UPI0004CA21C5|nr:hypothetical protein [Streptomyces sp. NRRL S-646]